VAAQEGKTCSDRAATKALMTRSAAEAAAQRLRPKGVMSTRTQRQPAGAADRSHRPPSARWPRSLGRSLYHSTQRLCYGVAIRLAGGAEEPAGHMVRCLRRRS
jgi:hypothetical protein